MSTLPFPFPQSEFIPWQPDTDGATLAVPAPANSLTPYPTLRIQNTTRGTLYISNNIGSEPSEGVYDYRIGPYSSETITPNAQGVQVLWRGIAGSSETVGFTWSALTGAPGGSSVGEPYFPTSQNVSWFPDDAGVDYTYIGQFLSAIGTLAAWEIAPPLGNQGQTIVAVQIENRSGYTLTVRKDDNLGELLGVVEPFRATTLQVGTNQLYVTRDFGSHWGGGQEQVTFYAYNSIPKLDPAAMFELPGVHEPAGSGQQVSIAASTGGGGALVYTVPAGRTLVIQSATLEQQSLVGAAITTEAGALRLTQSLTGQGGISDILATGTVGGVASIQHSRAGLTGPLLVPSRPLPFAPNTINTVRTLGAVPTIFTVSITGWLLP